MAEYGSHAQISSKKDIQFASPVTTMSTSPSFTNIAPELLASEKIWRQETTVAAAIVPEKTPPSHHTLSEPASIMKQTSCVTHSDLPIPETDTKVTNKKTSVKRKLFADEETSLH